MAINIFEDSFLTARGYFLYKSLMNETQYYNRDKIEEFKFNAIYKLLNNVCKHIPYYKNLFWEYDFDTSKFQSLEDLQKLPSLSKETILKSPHDFLSATHSLRGLELSTSGTSGNPFKTFSSRNQWIVEQASIWRHWDWANYKFRDKMAIIRSYSPREGEPITKLNKLKNWLYISPYHLSENNVINILKILQNWKPKYLRGYPSSLYVLALIAKNNKIKINSLKGAFTASEVLTEEYRSVIEDAFDIKVFDHYGQAEITAMMHECDAHDGLHLLEDYSHNEFEDSDCKEEKRLIATNLFNFAMPLIRYETGDKVVLSNKKCSCGRTFPKVKKIIGRSDALLFHKEGYFIPSINFYSFFSKLTNISKFQIIQFSKKDVEIKIQIINKKDKDKLVVYIEEEMSKRFGTKVIVSNTEQFTMARGGKCNPIIQKIK